MAIKAHDAALERPLAVEFYHLDGFSDSCFFQRFHDQAAPERGRQPRHSGAVCDVLDCDFGGIVHYVKDADTPDSK